jgi:hypothetical protein
MLSSAASMIVAPQVVQEQTRGDLPEAVLRQ